MGVARAELRPKPLAGANNIASAGCAEPEGAGRPLWLIGWVRIVSGNNKGGLGEILTLYVHVSPCE